MEVQEIPVHGQKEDTSPWKNSRIQSIDSPGISGNRQREDTSLWEDRRW